TLIGRAWTKGEQEAAQIFPPCGHHGQFSLGEKILQGRFVQFIDRRHGTIVELQELRQVLVSDPPQFVALSQHSHDFSLLDLELNCPLRHRLIRSKPYSDGSELDECEVVVGVFFVSRGDGAEVLEFVEEALDEVSVTIKKGTESRRVEASGHWFDARPGAAFLDRLTQSVGVVGAVSEQDVSLAQT